MTCLVTSFGCVYPLVNPSLRLLVVLIILSEYLDSRTNQSS